MTLHLASSAVFYCLVSIFIRLCNLLLGSEQLDNSTAAEATSSSTYTPSSDTANNLEQGSSFAAPKDSLFSIAFWRHYFDVNTDQVLKRILAAFQPQSSELERIFSTNPFDLFATLICFCFFKSLQIWTYLDYNNNNSFKCYRRELFQSLTCTRNSLLFLYFPCTSSFL